MMTDRPARKERRPRNGIPADAVDLRPEIERRAYFRYCARGCEHGFELDDWLAAEREFLAERGPARRSRSPRRNASR